VFGHSVLRRTFNVRDGDKSDFRNLHELKNCVLGWVLEWPKTGSGRVRGGGGFLTLPSGSFIQYNIVVCKGLVKPCYSPRLCHNFFCSLYQWLNLHVQWLQYAVLYLSTLLPRVQFSHLWLAFHVYSFLLTILFLTQSSECLAITVLTDTKKPVNKVHFPEISDFQGESDWWQCDVQRRQPATSP